MLCHQKPALIVVREKHAIIPLLHSETSIDSSRPAVARFERLLVEGNTRYGGVDQSVRRPKVEG
jgi:hypothetical protein